MHISDKETGIVVAAVAMSQIKVDIETAPEAAAAAVLISVIQQVAADDRLDFREMLLPTTNC